MDLVVGSLALRATLADSLIAWSAVGGKSAGGPGGPADKPSAIAVSAQGQVHLAVKADADGMQVTSLAGSTFSVAGLTSDFAGQHVSTGPMRIELTAPPSVPIMQARSAGVWNVDVPLKIGAENVAGTFSGGVEVSGPAAQLDGRLGMTSGAGPTVAVNLSFGDATLLCPKAGLIAAGGSGHVPVTWNTTAPSGAANQFEIKTVSVKGRDLGSITGTANVNDLKTLLPLAGPCPAAAFLPAAVGLIFPGSCPPVNSLAVCRRRLSRTNK